MGGGSSGLISYNSLWTAHHTITASRDVQPRAHKSASYVYQVLIRSGQVAGSALYNVTATSAWPTRNGEIEEGGGDWGWYGGCVPQGGGVARHSATCSPAPPSRSGLSRQLHL